MTHIATRTLSPTSFVEPGARLRGLSDIWATLLGIIVGLGILGAVMLVFRQATFSSHIAAEQQSIMQVSTEVKSILKGRSSYGASGTDITSEIIDASMVPASGFKNVTIIALDQSFQINFQTGSMKECARLATLDFGEDTVLHTSSCATTYRFGVEFTTPPEHE